MSYTYHDGMSSGSQWVRNRGGWRIANREYEDKPMEDDRLFVGQSGARHSQRTTNAQPRIFITKRNSREREMQVSFGQALKDLDMSAAARDLRIFNYVCQLLSCVAQMKLTSLSGTGLSAVLHILQDVIDRVVDTNNNMDVGRKLLSEFKSGLVEGYHQRIGSASLWIKHTDTVDRLQNTMDTLQIHQRENDGLLEMNDMPDDCIRLILLRINNHEDLVNFGVTNSRTAHLVRENKLWEKLCSFHFTEKQIERALKKGAHIKNLRWMTVYFRLYKQHGAREAYADMLQMCGNCNSIYWLLHGHDCVFPDHAPATGPVSPKSFVELA